MLADVVEYLCCPHCGAELALGAGTLQCGAGHSFDVARQGYVSLLPGAPRAASGDSAAMVAARELFLGAGHFEPLEAALAAAAAGAPAGGCVADLGAGTGWQLARVLDALPPRPGLALDVSRPALRRAARAHPRIGAVGCDIWGALPMRPEAVGLMLNVFAPRNGAEMARVMAPDARLVVVTPTPRHLEELAGPLGLLSVDERKPERLEARARRPARAGLERGARVEADARRRRSRGARDDGAECLPHRPGGAARPHRGAARARRDDGVGGADGLAAALMLSELPIVQAPMGGGPSTPELAAAVGEAGGLGFLAAGYRSVAAVRADIAALRGLSRRPFGINLFAPPAEPGEPAEIARYAEELRGDAERRGVELGEPRHDDDGWEEKLALCADERVPLVSFTFGCPDAAVLRRLHEAGCSTWVTVTTPAEAAAATRRGRRTRSWSRASRRAGTAARSTRPSRASWACSRSCSSCAPRRACRSSQPAASRTRSRRGRARGGRQRRAARHGVHADSGGRHRGGTPAGASRQRAHGADARVHRTPSARHREPLYPRARARRAARLPRGAPSDGPPAGRGPCGTAIRTG